VSRRDLLGETVGYESGGGYRGLLTTRETVKAILILLPLLAAAVLAQILLGDRLSTALSRIALALGIGWMNLRVLRNPEVDGEARTPAERRRLRLWAGAGVALAALLGAVSLYQLLAPHPISAPE
jgi:hypothetical protein